MPSDSESDDDLLRRLIVNDEEAVRIRERRHGMTVAQVDEAIARGREQAIPADDLALLWITRGNLLGLELGAEHLQLLMDVGAHEAEEIVARLSEHGLIDRQGGRL